jgi:hypothetical protein
MSKHTMLASAALVPALMAVLAQSAGAAATCPISYGMHDDAKPNKLFLYFPTTADSTFPEFAVTSSPTSPAEPFDAADLTSYTGTTAALRDAVRDVVVDDYCEFNVQVRQTTTAPSAAQFPRRNVVAIGSDGTGTGLFGQAERVDTGDAFGADSARVWAGTYQELEGGAGGALNGANSTLARWARSIGGTAAHEAGHNYGLAHSDDTNPAPGEDAATRHVMPAGSTLTGEHRAGYRRHFSDRTFSLLASNVGLSVQTMHNWDLVNPNAQTAHRLAMEFLTQDPAAILSWFYNGNRSPWTSPTVTNLGQQTFKGQTYDRYRILWSTGKSWDGPTPGQVPGGATFHIGATFSGVDFDAPDDVIITRLQLQDASGNPLALQPRLPGYDAGTLDVSDGTLDLNFFNVGGAQPLELQNVIARELPRTLSIDAMMPDAEELLDVAGEPFSAWPGSTRMLVRRSEPIDRGGTLPVEVARLAQGRHILEEVAKDCDAADDAKGGPDTGGCVPGFNVDLFPATSLYVTANVVTPNARHWDPQLEQYVTGPLTTRVFLQVAGRHPDLNRNEVDDAIDIASRTSADENGDGVPDESRLFEMR